MLLKEFWCYSKVACRRREIKTGCCDATGAEERKGARRRQCYISLCSLWHDEIFDNWLCGARVQTHWEKCGREVGMHEMEQKGEQRRERGFGEGGTRGDMSRLQSAKEKWTAGGEICSGRCVFVWRVRACVCASTCICIPPHIYLPVYNKHAPGPERISFAKISICQFN